MRPGIVTDSTCDIPQTLIEQHGIEVVPSILIMDGKLVTSAKSVEESVLNLLKTAKAEELELVTLIYGEGVSRGEADRIVDIVREKFPALEIEVQDGGQPHYRFIISIE